MKAQDALMLIFSRNAFYKRLHYLIMSAFLLSFFVIFLLTAMLVYLIKNPVHPVYFAADNVGRLLEVLPTNKPSMTTQDALNWTVEAIEATYSYDYLNYRSQLQDAQKYFTRFGWAKYMSALSASNNLVGLVQRKMTINARVIGQPAIITAGILNDSYAWKMKMPVLVTYSVPPYNPDDPKSTFANVLDVEVIIQRQPTLKSYKGLGIVQLVSALVTSTPDTPKQISGTSTN